MQTDYADTEGNVRSVEYSRPYQSNFKSTSRENVDSIGVIASSAVCFRNSSERQKEKEIRWHIHGAHMAKNKKDSPVYEASRIRRVRGRAAPARVNCRRSNRFPMTDSTARTRDF